MKVQPYNSAHTKVTVYDTEGNPVEVSRLSALDLTRDGRATWNAPSQTTKVVIEEEPEVPAPATVDEETAPAPEQEPKPPFLEEEAALIAGEDKQAYLKGFSPAALKSMIAERFGHEIEGKINKSALIAKFIELEAAAN